MNTDCVYPMAFLEVDEIYDCYNEYKGNDYKTRKTLINMAKINKIVIENGEKGYDQIENHCVIILDNGEKMCVAENYFSVSRRLHSIMFTSFGDD